MYALEDHPHLQTLAHNEQVGLHLTLLEMAVKFNVEMVSDTQQKNEMMTMTMLLLMDALNLVILMMVMLVQEEQKQAKILVQTELLSEQLFLRIKQHEW